MLRRLALACLMSCLAAPAWAMNVDGKVGIGFEESLTGMHARIGRTLRNNRGNLPDVLASGLVVRGFVGDWAIEGMVGGDFHAAEGQAKEIGRAHV